MMPANAPAGCDKSGTAGAVGADGQPQLPRAERGEPACAGLRLQLAVGQAEFPERRLAGAPVLTRGDLDDLDLLCLPGMRGVVIMNVLWR